MAKAKTLVGLDVHAAKVVAAILDSETGEVRFERLGGETAPVVSMIGRLPRPIRATYEAGPTGYGLARALEATGVDCLVAAPARSRVEQQSGSRPIAVTPSIWSGCSPPASFAGSGCRGLRRSRCATWSGPARTFAWT